MAQVHPFRTWNHSHQVALDGNGLFVSGKSQPPSQPLDVGVNHNTCGNSECRSQHDVRRLASNTGKFRQRLHVAGNLAMELFDQVLWPSS